MSDTKNPTENPPAPKEKKPRAQLVIYAEGGIGAAYVDNPDAAKAHAEAVEGVVVDLPVTIDRRPA